MIFLNKEYWEVVKMAIQSQRTEKERDIESRAFMSLSEEEQKLSMALRNREKLEFARAMGFEIGSKVANANGELFVVDWIMDCSGLLDLDHISIHIHPENGDRLSSSIGLYSRTANVHGLKEGNYFDNYYPVRAKGGVAV